ncbi:MAG: NAD(P)/FAD-dependent oxidoreductase [Patescibacteria group bacterium]|nr:MAG: NAD(P)/FAD-dependent oxidoreductase [Patescibacteria group bacterium]
MREVEILIIGGGAAGTTAAETYRVGGGQGDVVIVSDEAHQLYSRVLLPHAAKGKISPEKAFLKNEAWYAEKRIELMRGRSVLRVDYKRSIATLDGDEEISYKKLLIAVGGKPRAWQMSGADHADVLQLQTYEDAIKLRERLVPDMRMAIVGSGFIAIEFAAACVEKGVKATLINRGPHFWTSALGEKIGHAVQAALEAKGVEVRNGAKVAAVEVEGGISGVTLSTGETVPCNLVGVGIGIETPMEPFGDLRGTQGLLADAYLKASHENVWVAGDCAEYDDEVVGFRRVVGNWANAIAQGRHVGQALLGRHEKFVLLTGYSTAVFPGASLLFLGESRMLPEAQRYERVLEDGKKIVEFRTLGGRVIGATLLNAVDQRAAAAALITSGVSVAGRESDLADPHVPLDGF